MLVALASPLFLVRATMECGFSFVKIIYRERRIIFLNDILGL